MSFTVFFLKFIILWIATLPIGTVVLADVVTFNSTGVANLTRQNATLMPTETVATFEFRTSHEARSIWGLYGPRASSDNISADGSTLLLSLGLTMQQLIVDWPTNASHNRVDQNFTDGNWHSVSIRLDSNATELTIIADGVDLLRLLADPMTASITIFNWTMMTFGGVNGSDGLRGCLANATVREALYSENFTADVTNVQLVNSTGATLGCREDPCICANSGSCLPRLQWNRHAGCNCTGTGFGGELCLVARDFCNTSSGAGDPCSGHGFCTSNATLETFVCNCTDGYSGANCSTPPITTKTTTEYRSTERAAQTTEQTTPLEQQGTPAPHSDTRLVVGLVVGLLLLLLAGAAGGLAFKIVRDRRKDTGVYKPSDRELSSARSGQHGVQDILRPPNEERLI